MIVNNRRITGTPLLQWRASAHHRVASDPAGRKPVSRTRARGDADLECAVRAADDFLAGETVTLQGIRNEAPLLVIERQRPEPRRRSHAADDYVAAAVERLPAVIGRCRKRHAVAGSARQP